MVESIAAGYWRLARLYRVEAGLIARRRDAAQRSDSLAAPQPHPALAQLRAARARLSGDANGPPAGDASCGGGS